MDKDYSILSFLLIINEFRCLDHDEITRPLVLILSFGRQMAVLLAVYLSLDLSPATVLMRRAH